MPHRLFGDFKLPKSAHNYCSSCTLNINGADISGTEYTVDVEKVDKIDYSTMIDLNEFFNSNGEPENSGDKVQQPIAEPMEYVNEDGYLVTTLAKIPNDNDFNSTLNRDKLFERMWKEHLAEVTEDINIHRFIWTTQSNIMDDNQCYLSDTTSTSTTKQANFSSSNDVCDSTKGSQLPSENHKNSDTDFELEHKLVASETMDTNSSTINTHNSLLPTTQNRNISGNSTTNVNAVTDSETQNKGTKILTEESTDIKAHKYDIWEEDDIKQSNAVGVALTNFDVLIKPLKSLASNISKGIKNMLLEYTQLMRRVCVPLPKDAINPEEGKYVSSAVSSIPVYNGNLASERDIEFSANKKINDAIWNNDNLVNSVNTIIAPISDHLVRLNLLNLNYVRRNDFERFDFLNQIDGILDTWKSFSSKKLSSNTDHGDMN